MKLYFNQARSGEPHQGDPLKVGKGYGSNLKVEVPYVTEDHHIIEQDIPASQLNLQVTTPTVVQPIHTEEFEDNPKVSVVSNPTGPTPGDTSPNTNQIAFWIQPQHRTPFCLAISLYSVPSIYKDGYRLIEKTVRVCAWLNDGTGEIFIGCRGTSSEGEFFIEDVSDDVILALLERISGGIAHPGLPGEAAFTVEKLRGQGYSLDKMMIGGHSLGGYSAFKVAKQYAIKACSFNGAGCLLNTLTDGPGPSLATHYHIYGDLVSTHVSVNAANIVRVKKYNEWQSGFVEHAWQRFLQADPIIGFVSADEEQNWMYEFMWRWIYSSLHTEAVLTLAAPGWVLELLGGISTAVFLQCLVILNPIPGSKWWYLLGYLEPWRVKTLSQKVARDSVKKAKKEPVTGKKPGKVIGKKPPKHQDGSNPGHNPK